MQILREVSTEVEHILKRRSVIASNYHERVMALGGSLTAKAGDSLFQYLGNTPSLLYIEEGSVQQKVQGTPMFLWEEGDLLFLSKESSLGVEIQGDFAMKIRVLPIDALLLSLQKVGDEKSFFTFLGLEIALRERMLVELFGSHGGLNPSLRHFKSGDIIIEEGGTGTSIFTLAQGAARAMVGGITVGDIGENEIFGTLAALTKRPRTATVVAETNCLVLEVPVEQFLPFLLSRPSTIMQVLQEMANTIVHLNGVVKEAHS